MLEMKESKVDQKDEKYFRELKDDSYLKGKEVGEIILDNKYLVNVDIK